MLYSKKSEIYLCWSKFWSFSNNTYVLPVFHVLIQFSPFSILIFYSQEYFIQNIIYIYYILILFMCIIKRHHTTIIFYKVKCKTNRLINYSPIWIDLFSIRRVKNRIRCNRRLPASPVRCRRRVRWSKRNFSPRVSDQYVSHGLSYRRNLECAVNFTKQKLLLWMITSFTYCMRAHLEPNAVQFRRHVNVPANSLSWRSILLKCQNEGVTLKTLFDCNLNL